MINDTLIFWGEGTECWNFRICGTDRSIHGPRCNIFVTFKAWMSRHGVSWWRWWMSRCARKEGRTGGLCCGSQSENLATSLSIGKRGRGGGRFLQDSHFSNHWFYRKLWRWQSAVQKESVKPSNVSPRCQVQGNQEYHSIIGTYMDIYIYSIILYINEKLRM